MAVNFASVLFVADFEKHFDSDATERGEPHGAAVINFDDVCPRFGNVVEQFGKHTGTVGNEQFEHYVTSLPDKNLFENSGQQIRVNISAAQNDADVIIRIYINFLCQKRGESSGACAFDNQTIVL